MPLVREIGFGDKTRADLLAGVTELAEAVKVTMGPRGRNVIIEHMSGIPTITKDGVSVAREVFLDNPVSNMAAQLVKSVATKVANEAGDGTTTATVLTHAIFKEGNRALSTGSNPILLKRGMDITVERIVKELSKISKKINQNDTDDLLSIATISANSDRVIGELITNAVSKVGMDGLLVLEKSNNSEDVVELIDGFYFDNGLINDNFIKNRVDMSTTLENAKLLLINKDEVELADVEIFIKEINENIKRPIAIIANSFTDDLASRIAIANNHGGFHGVLIKAPSFGDNRTRTMIDLAALTGSKVFDPSYPDDLSIMGDAGKIKVDRKRTIISGIKNINDVEVRERVEHLKLEISKPGVSEYEIKRLKERLAHMTTGVITIKVGGVSEAEVSERRDRVEDALCATRSSLEEGVVVGGGSALIRAGAKIDVSDLSGDEAMGASIILKAITAPLEQISTNAGYNGQMMYSKLLEIITENDPEKINYGFDASTGEFVDMIKAGIIDPAKVERVALENATSVASLLLTSEASLIYKEKSK